MEQKIQFLALQQEWLFLPSRPPMHRQNLHNWKHLVKLRCNYATYCCDAIKIV